MNEVTWLIDGVTGALLVERMAIEEVSALAGDLLSPPHELLCARPVTMLLPAGASDDEMVSGPCVRIAGYYHNSLIEGPGRRSTVKLQGCPIRCRGCITPDSWNPDAGTLVPVDRLVQALLDPAFTRDGISIVGGEPFHQPQGLWTLIRELRMRGCAHILVYSGYTCERLWRMADRESAIGAVLENIDVLIDGPFVAALAGSGGPWTGSGNQRVIDLVTTRRLGQVILREEQPSLST